MITKILYRVKRADGGVSVSPIKPEGDCEKLVRIIADEGKVVTKDGLTLFNAIDTESAEGWREIDEIPEK